MPEIIELSDLDKGLIEMINDAVKTKKLGEICDISDLLDPIFFEATESEHTHIGRRISFLVSVRALPLEFYGFNSNRHNQYIVVRHKDGSPVDTGLNNLSQEMPV